MAKKEKSGGLSVTVDLPNLPKGQEMGVVGLGVVTNGQTLEVTEDMERSFLAAQNRTVKSASSSRHRDFSSASPWIGSGSSSC